jgi:hypothetical protein
MSLVATAQAIHAKANSFQPVNNGSNNDDRARDGLLGPVRRVHTSRQGSTRPAKSSRTMRLLLETAEYD